MYSEPLTGAAQTIRYGGGGGGALPQEKLMQVDPSTAWRDKPCAVAFYLHLLLMLFFAFFYGTKAVSADAVSVTQCVDNCLDSAPYDLNADIMVRAIVTAVFVGALCAVVMMYLLQRMGGALIASSFFLSIGVKVAVGVAFFSAGLIVPGVLLCIAAAFTLMYYYCVRSRVRFAAAHVQISTLSLSGAPDLIFLNLTLLLSQGIWSILWGLAALGVEYSINNKGSGGQGTGTSDSGDKGLSGSMAVFFLLLSYFWVSGLIHNIAAFCSASVLGDWWWKGASEPYPVRGAMKRAFTTSFGTIAMGAFLVALCNTLKAMKKMAERGARGEGEKPNPIVMLACCLLGCVLNIVSAIAEWANQCVTSPPFFVMDLTSPLCPHAPPPTPTPSTSRS